MANFPEEILEEILLCLPPKSLMRFKCVCKSWHALINGHEFVSKHLVNALQQRNSPSSSAIILFKHIFTGDARFKENKLSFFSYPSDDGTHVDINWPPEMDSLRLEIQDHIHGIVCLSDRYANTFLCNPATGEFRKLPSSIILPELPKDGYGYNYYFVGFGYDPKSKNLKVVRVVFGFRNPSVAEVYDLSANLWREIIVSLDIFVVGCAHCEFYLDGAYYWLVDLYHYNEMIILSFDMDKEVFHLIPIPVYSYSLGVLNGSIVLFDYPHTADGGPINIWMMEKDESWSVLMTIDPIPRIVKPLMFINSDELIVLLGKDEPVISPDLTIHEILKLQLNRNRDQDIFSYNLNTRELKKFLVIENQKRMIVEATHFLKSLLSVKGGRELSLILEKVESNTSGKH